jgi:hypothetical protein
MVLASAGCSKGTPSNTQNPPTTPPPTTPAPDDGTLTGRERLAWDQEVAAGVDIRTFSFVAYVDTIRTVLNGVSCQPISGNSLASCSAALPLMSAGRHIVQVAAVRQVGSGAAESDKSAVFFVTMGGAAALASSATAAGDGVAGGAISSPMAAAPDDGEHGAALTIETLSRGVRDVTDLAVAPDGDVFVAERRGVLRIFRDGAFQREPALTLADAVADGANAELLSIAVPDDYASERRLYFLYTAPTRDGAVYRIASGRMAGGRVGEIATFTGGGLAAAKDRAVVRVAPDGKLYAALPDGAAPPRADGSRTVRILRVNADGSTPRENPGFSRVIGSADRVLGLAWNGAAGAFYALAVRGGASVLSRIGSGDASSAPVPDITLLNAEHPAALAWYGRTAIEPFAGRLIVATSDGTLRGIDANAPASQPAPIALPSEAGVPTAMAAAPDGAIYLAASPPRRIQAPVAGADTSTGDLILRIRQHEGGL